jgi:hypothetical protein
MQNIGCGRGVNRTTADPLNVLVLTDVPLPQPLPLTIAGVITAVDVARSPGDWILAAAAELRENLADAVAAYPGFRGLADGSFRPLLWCPAVRSALPTVRLSEKNRCFTSEYYQRASPRLRNLASQGRDWRDKGTPQRRQGARRGDPPPRSPRG